jgi:hypothetical protein
MVNELTSLPSVREYLKIAASDTTYDSLLTNLIKRSQMLIEKYCGRQFKARDYTEYYDGDGTSKLLLKQWPIVSVTELNMDNARSFLSVTQALAADFVIWSEEGYLELLSAADSISGFSEGGSLFRYGQQNIKVRYNAGYAAIPEDLELASIIHVANLYNKAGMDGHSSISLGGLAKSFSTKPFPDEVVMYLEPYRKRAC